MKPSSLRLAMRDGAVVLLRAVDVVRSAVVGDHVIELRGRLIVLAASRFCRRRGVTVTPPSLEAIMRRVFFGSIHRP